MDRKTTKNSGQSTAAGKGHISTTEKIALGVTGVAVAAGVVAAGVALSDRGNRKKLAKGAKTAYKNLTEAASNAGDELQDRYVAVAHQVDDMVKQMPKKGRTGKKKT